MCSVLAGGMFAIDSSGEALWKMHNSGVCSYSFSSPHPTISDLGTKCKEKLRVLSLGASLLGFSLGTLYIKVSNKVNEAYLACKYEKKTLKRMVKIVTMRVCFQYRNHLKKPWIQSIKPKRMKMLKELTFGFICPTKPDCVFMSSSCGFHTSEVQTGWTLRKEL